MKLLAQVAVSAIVLALVFSLVSFQDVWRALTSVGPTLWAFVLLVFLIGHVVSAYKWRLLAAPGAPFGAVLRAHFAGLAANLALPGAATGDIVRAGVMASTSKNKASVAVGSLADRLIDVLGLVIIAAVGVLVAAGAGGHAELALWLGLAALAAFAGALVTRPIMRALAAKTAEATSGPAKILNRLSAAAEDLTRQPARLLACLVLSMLVQIVFVLLNAELGRAAGVEAPLAAWFFAWPVSKLIATIPISFGGIGVREASLACLMAPFGANAAMVVAAGLVWQSILIVGSLGGAALSLLQKSRPATAALAEARSHDA